MSDGFDWVNNILDSKNLNEILQNFDFKKVNNWIEKLNNIYDTKYQYNKITYLDIIYDHIIDVAKEKYLTELYYCYFSL